MPRPLPCSTTDQCSHRKPWKQIYQLSFSPLARPFVISHVSWISILGWQEMLFPPSISMSRQALVVQVTLPSPEHREQFSPSPSPAAWLKAGACNCRHFMPLSFFFFISAGRGDLGLCFCTFRVPSCLSLSGHLLSVWLQEPLKLKPSETQAPSTTQSKMIFSEVKACRIKWDLSQLLSSLVF